MCDDGSLRVHVFVKGGSGDVYQCGLVVFVECFGGVFIPPLEVGWGLCVWASVFGAVGWLVSGGWGGCGAGGKKWAMGGVVGVGYAVGVVVPWTAFCAVVKSGTSLCESFVACSALSCSV